MSAGIGQFTGDALSSGYALGRNSSRVLAPPGGKSSNIFGWAQEAPEAAPTAAHKARNDSTIFRSPIRAPVRETTTAAANRRNESKVFSESPASPKRRGRAAVPWGETDDSTSMTSSNAAPQAYAAPAEPKAYAAPASPMRQQQSAATSNGLHAERSDYGPASGKSRSVHTSSRVLAPPGGRCSNIFG